MKRLFKKFPEILLIDATYNVNGVGMPLDLDMATTEEDSLHLQKNHAVIQGRKLGMAFSWCLCGGQRLHRMEDTKRGFLRQAILFCQWHVMNLSYV